MLAYSVIGEASCRSNQLRPESELRPQGAVCHGPRGEPAIALDITK